MAKTVKTVSGSASKTRRQTNIPMNWFKFIIWCQLFLTALSELSNAFLYLTGRYYTVQGINPAEFYSQYPLFRIVNYLFGGVGVVMCIFAIYTRFQLAGFKKGAPGLFLKYTMISVAKTGIYVLLYVIVSTIYGKMTTMAELMDYISLMIGGTALYFINKSYFAKREFLFDR